MKATTPPIIAVNKLFIFDNFNSDYLNDVGWVDVRKPNKIKYWKYSIMFYLHTKKIKGKQSDRHRVRSASESYTKIL